MRGLILPFEQMTEQDFQPADQLLTVASPHAVQFLDQVLNIKILKSMLSEQIGGLACPGMNVAVIQGHRVIVFIGLISGV